MDEFNFPLQDLDDPAIPKTSPMMDGVPIPSAKESEVYHVNYVVQTAEFAFGAAALSAEQPCVRYFTSDYPYSPTDIYGTDPEIAADEPWATFDSTYSQQPKGGWLSLKRSPDVFAKFARYLLSYQLRSWMLYDYSSNINPADLGSRPSVAPVKVQNVGTLPSLKKNANVANGLLDTIETRLFFNSTEMEVELVPFYVRKTENLDLAIGGSIESVISALAEMDKEVLFDEDATFEDITNFYVGAAKITRDVPHGALYFNLIDHARKNYSYVMHIGSDKRLGRAAGFPTESTRQMVQQAQLGNALFRYSDPSKQASVISQSVRAMPSLHSTRLELPFSSFVGRILFPFAVTFLLPSFVVILVREKEDRILGMMKMNGLKTWTYWLAHYIHFYCLHVLSSAVFLLAGLAAKMTMFTNTHAGVLILMMFMWGHAQVALAFFFGSLFGRSRTALVIVFLIVLCSVLVSLAGEMLFTETAPAAYFIWPPFAFYRILGTVNRASFRKDETPYTISSVKPGDEVFTAIMFLFWEWFVFMGLAAFLGADGFGRVRRLLKQQWNGRREKKDFAKVVDEEAAAKSAAPEANVEDDDVVEERNRVLNSQSTISHPLIVKNLQKTYASGKQALKTLTLAAESDLVFGLLGPNGAGKSTTISILTGLYDASGGDAYVAGYSINTERSAVWKLVGICPQHDILWDDLTCEEHLLFYARLKGIPKAREHEVVEKSLATVALSGPFKNRLSKGLSGGEKRRLSIAIALVGDPVVVFLDEPTTGLDPEVRRLIWNIIDKAKYGKTIVLTTHSMEEAEVLCQRIGIMAHGRMRCLGTPFHLKSLYANSFKLTFTVENPDLLPSACAFIESQVLPPGWKIVSRFMVQVTYEFPRKIMKSKNSGTSGHSSDASETEIPVRVAEMFDLMEDAKPKYGITEWAVGETTLDEVFIKTIGKGGEDSLES
ncbi:hypothetical protein HDU85_006666 [Gaertneriomyces sp. JEL0708]|nr:hypothetical protein HDU85_006666 [Gaertneriomyces sp. JEL0708]